MNRPLFRFYNFDTNNGIHNHSLRLFGGTCWSFYYHNRFGWFRLFGKGLKWKDVTIYELIFSERQKLTKVLTIGKWRISFLK